jgi:hypothetical protein
MQNFAPGYDRSGSTSVELVTFATFPLSLRTADISANIDLRCCGANCRRAPPSISRRDRGNLIIELPSGLAEIPIIATRSQHAIGGRTASIVIDPTRVCRFSGETRCVQFCLQ